MGPWCQTEVRQEKDSHFLATIDFTSRNGTCCWLILSAKDRKLKFKPSVVWKLWKWCLVTTVGKELLVRHANSCTLEQMTTLFISYTTLVFWLNFGWTKLLNAYHTYWRPGKGGLPNGQLVCAARKLTALDGEDGEVMNRVGLSVERLSCADDPTKSVHVKEPLQVCVSVNGVPGQKCTTTHNQHTL